MFSFPNTFRQNPFIFLCSFPFKGNDIYRFWNWKWVRLIYAMYNWSSRKDLNSTKHGYNLEFDPNWPLYGVGSGLEVSVTKIRHYIVKLLIKTFNLIPKMAIFEGWPFMTHLGEQGKGHDDPIKGMVWTGGEQDPQRRSLNVEVLIKTLKLIPTMAIFGDWPLYRMRSELQASETNFSHPFLKYSSRLSISYQSQLYMYLLREPLLPLKGVGSRS